MNFWVRVCVLLREVVLPLGLLWACQNPGCSQPVLSSVHMHLSCACSSQPWPTVFRIMWIHSRRLCGMFDCQKR